VNLTELELADTQISDVTPLAKCKKLEKLSIKHTTVADISPLKGLDKLKFLYVEGCAITNLDSLAPLVTRGLRIVTVGGAVK
jgi:internalin A